MTSKKSHHFDYLLIITVAVLLILGILILASVSAVFSQEKFGETGYYLFHQIILGLGVGILLGFIAYKMPLSFFKKGGWVFLLINLVLMVLVFIPKLGVVSGGAPRWINFGFFTFQPSEFLKLTFIIYLSAWLAGRTKKRLSTKDEKSWKLTLLPFLLILGFIALLLHFQSDASTLALIVAIAALMYFFSSTPLWHTLLISSVIGGGLIFLITFTSYRINRVLILLGLIDDPMGACYQIKQALITIGSGGIFGLGLGMSNQKFGGFLPQTMSDSIFAVFAEEAGFIGCFVLISLFLVFLWRSFRIVKDSQDRFSQLFAGGISSWICLQAFINIGAMVGILPLTGIPLPFISYGGSHMVAELVGIGILLNISKSSRK